ncbi:hypothetical protein LJ739_05370 [Aestuariibacter halophilus]|uniref:Uncharacterized protein n=1 Tax=Fluctibacter halophilus TaxID=226011 RepID=A0ABS8G594_9ALTE|nr:hypothetical protein [Aestuariibacter halophilus]MCC2615664.1 hypothetical protein [Aestuariibacter halophilus]
MKHLIDIHVVLSTVDDMDHWEEQAEDASERLNTLLHMVYDAADDDIPVPRLENQLQHVWENWREDSYLLDIDLVDLRDWVDHLLATWDDDDSHDL